MRNRSTAAPIIQVQAVAKAYGALAPLRIQRLDLHAGQRLVLMGLDATAAEMFVNLLTGASVPDEGSICIEGRDTRAIATDTEWLASLDRFGLVTLRAVLIGPLPVVQNLALPMTLSIDPMSDDVRTSVEALAREVGLTADRWSAATETLSPAEVVRVHLARALALAPALLLLEHPTAHLPAVGDRRAFGQLVAAVARARGIGWLALSNDEAFASGSAAVSATLHPESGVITRRGWWRRLRGGSA